MYGCGGQHNSHEFMKGADHFINGAERDREKKSEKLFVVFVVCCNIQSFVNSKEIKSHLIFSGFKNGYTHWIWHGESKGEIV